MFKLFDLLLETIEDIDKIYEKYYSKIPYNRFKIISLLDSRSRSEGEKVSILGKYSKLLLNLELKGNLKTEDFSLAKEYINILYKHNVSLDWNKINDISDIYPYVQKYLAKSTGDFHEILNHVTEGVDYKKVFDGQQYEVYTPLTEKGSCYLGIGAEWCTTWGPMSLNDRNKDKTNRFEHYNSQGPLYIIVSKTDPTHRVQWHFENKEFKNLQNGDVDPKRYLEHSEELLNFFFPISEDSKILQKYFAFGYILPSEYFQRIKKLYAEINGIDYNDVLQVDTNNFSSDDFMNYIGDSGIEDVSISRNVNILFYIETNTDNIITEIERYLGTLEAEKDNMSPSQYMFDGAEDYLSERIEELFKEYYEKNVNKLIKVFGTGAKNYDDFHENIYDKFEKEFKRKYEEKFDEKNYSNVDDAFNTEIESIEKYVRIKRTWGGGGKYEVYLNAGYFNQYNIKNSVNYIKDFKEYLEQYCDEYNVPTSLDYYEYPNIDYDFPKLDDFESDFDDYFDTLSEEVNLDLVDKLNKIIDKFFNGDGTYEDKNKKIEVDYKDVDFEQEKVMVTYRNKINGEKYEGYVKIDNLPKYVGMNMLAESYFNFKKIISL